VSAQSDVEEIRGEPARTHSVTTEQASNPVSAVGSLTQMIREECDVVDRTRAIPATVVDVLRDARVFHLLAPRAVGGAEADPLTFLRVVEEVSYADGSAGWCTMIGGSYAIFGGMLAPEGAREIFGDPATISAGNFRPGQRCG
jgi:indole-3-acetate monooxygenase